MLYNKLVLLIAISQLAYAANLVELNTQLKACNLKCGKYKDAAGGNNPIAKVTFDRSRVEQETSTLLIMLLIDCVFRLILLHVPVVATCT
jgi:hypothetical protein